MSTPVKIKHYPGIAQVALPLPLRRLFDYKIPEHIHEPLKPGVRVIVPLGHRRLTGVVIRLTSDSQVPGHKIRQLVSVVDDRPIITPVVFKLLFWLARYYQQPLGEVIKTALPGVYQPGAADIIKTYRLTDARQLPEILDGLERAPVQTRIVGLLARSNKPLNADQFKKTGPGWRAALNALVKKRIVEMNYDRECWPDNKIPVTHKAPDLTADQIHATQKISASLKRFSANLLKGVTGSGKTEVYLQLAQQVLDLNQQILILVPEIALTPQLVSRLENRLGLPAAVLHSSLSEKQRRLAWLAAATGQAKVILGTRSAVFTVLPALGLIILDEEHDMSYKQHEGVRYHARDVAIMRAKLENIPIVMGSATPSLESLANVKRGRFALCELKQRVGKAVMPTIHLLDMNQLGVKNGLCVTLINAIEKNLHAHKQSLVFINRRGYAPIVMCRDCGETACCKHCHARLTYHKDSSMQCHHCGARQSASDVCQSCLTGTLVKLGQGTQRVEELLKRLFPNATIARLDRDVISKKDQLETLLSRVAAKQIDILVGTQMLSKGHDFPDVTLVCVINADQGLFGLDFHSTESMIQQLIQVSGRAGRAQSPGKVLIQSHFPGHPLYRHISRHDYAGFADQELRIRQQAGFPPYHYLALVRASARNEKAPLNFLCRLKQMALKLGDEFPAINIMDPVYSPMAKRQNRYRTQLLVSSRSRSSRDKFLNKWVGLIEQCARNSTVRWSIDVDPLDLY